MPTVTTPRPTRSAASIQRVTWWRPGCARFLSLRRPNDAPCLLFVHDVGWVSWTPCSSGSSGERGMILAIWATAWRLLYRYEVYDTMTADSAFMDRHGFVRARYFTENACLGVDTESPTRGQPGLRAPRLRPRATLDGHQEATVRLRMVTATVGSASGVSAFVTICPGPRGEIPMPATTPR